MAKQTATKSRSRTGRLYRRWALFGTEKYSPRTRRRLAVINVVSLIASAMSVGYFSLYILYDFDSLWAPTMVVVIQSVLYLFSPIMHRISDTAGAYYFCGVWLAAILIICLLTGAENGAQYYFLPGAAGILLFFGPSRQVLASLLSVVPLALFVIIEVIALEPASFVHLDPFVLAFNYYAAVLGSYFLIFIMLLYAFTQTRRAEDALEREHERSERLLGNLLPDSIAVRLKDAPETIIADDLGQVTILFADIVDFTPRSLRMSPPDLVAFLNRIFTEFDKLAEKYGLEKIKTIGDAYMVAAGMPDPRPDHAEALAQMALDIIDVTQRLSREMGEDVAVRIGLHTGQAVAGVIGTRKFFYDVWGDTVNTAARMESHGEPGRIQVTREAYEALKEQYVFEARGEIEIKGKGKIDTWWLCGRR